MEQENCPLARAPTYLPPLGRETLCIQFQAAKITTAIAAAKIEVVTPPTMLTR
jgi:hypothetical protein